MSNVFNPIISSVLPLRLREPLAQTLGAFQTEDAILEYTFAETVKMAGHACPTVSGAWLICRKALEALYLDDIPVRGEIEVTVFGDPAEGVYGVIAQVLSFITGAAPVTGFKGLGYKFKRKDLLRYNAQKLDPEALCFQFRRVDTKRYILVKYYPHRVPLDRDKGLRLGELMEKVIWEAAKPAEVTEFRQLWMEKVNTILHTHTDIDQWLKIEERND
jgi:hypothetical protein